MDDTWTVSCPYCFQLVEVYFEADVVGELIQDCEVCCNPWAVRVVRDSHGQMVLVEAERAQ